MSDPRLAEADGAAAVGDFGRAIAMLNKVAESGGADLALWLKIAAMQRMSGKPEAALEAVHRALTFEPLNFTALLMRASLLQRLGQPAGEAWGYALAQRPKGDLP